ncbi:hypothetical protein NHQ30_010198 [Ciborinia camelliae]|nr:hypothetical protein NHQ30_010198 [Ciborinia camelliae]
MEIRAKYHPVIGDENFIDASLGRVSTESLNSTLLDSEYDEKSRNMDSAPLPRQMSPAAKAVEYQRVKFNNTMGTGSPYVGYGPDVDKAWSAISYDIGDQMILPDQLDNISMPKTHLKVKDPKTGVEGYRVGLEVFHQLHCINLLRQVTYRDWYEDISGEFKEGQKGLQMHTDHCLEILRMNVQCNADIGVFTLYMIEDDPLPWPELNSWHVCRNFNAIVDWATNNSVGIMEKHDNNTDIDGSSE